MEKFAKYFACIGFVGALHQFLTKQTNTNQKKLKVNLAILRYECENKLRQKTKEKDPATVKKFSKSKQEKRFLDNNYIETANNHLSLVDCEACNNDSEEDLKFIINKIEIKF